MFALNHMWNLAPTGFVKHEHVEHPTNSEQKFSSEESPAEVSIWSSWGRDKYADMYYFGDETEHLFPHISWTQGKHTRKQKTPTKQLYS